MGFRKEVLTFIRHQRLKDEASLVYKDIIEEFSLELATLRKTNKDLLDRLMARNFEELKVYQESDETTLFTEKDLAPDEDETNAGEVL